MVTLLVLLTVMGLPLVQSEITCHVCEVENSLNCSNPQKCPGDKPFCVVAAIRIFERFLWAAKLCTRTCPVPPVLSPDVENDESNPAPPKEFLIENPMPFRFAKCCKWDLCNGEGPPNLGLFKEQYGKASEKRHSYPELFLLGFIPVLTAIGLTNLNLL
ncbi:lymphocyte antigen 6K [Meriones unguiculatus]|uniref:lymphocyte antigen 6K n=1 Tax=Meriones unguiculatus TaxID=10047 RepID=UPI000B4EBBF7|nr:lymphocyte antigen 6K [Meriones unguiculatus]